jgi:hypothetical protein
MTWICPLPCDPLPAAPGAGTVGKPSVNRGGSVMAKGQVQQGKNNKAKLSTKEKQAKKKEKAAKK